MITVGFNIENSLFNKLGMTEQVIENFRFSPEQGVNNDFVVLSDIEKYKLYPAASIIFMVDKPFRYMHEAEKINLCRAVLHPKACYVLGYNNSSLDENDISVSTTEIIKYLCSGGSNPPRFRALHLSNMIPTRLGRQETISKVFITSKEEDKEQITKIIKALEEKGSAGYSLTGDNPNIIISGESQFSEDIPALYAHKGALYRGFFDTHEESAIIDSRFAIPLDIKLMINRKQTLTDSEVEYFDTVIQESRAIYASFDKVPKLAGECSSILERTIINILSALK